VKVIYDEVGIIPVHNTITTWGMKKNVDFTPTLKVNFDFMYFKDMKVK
jgi:hypothetical protein